MIRVFTIGYEGTDIERFVHTLKLVGIDVLVDVRAVAVSRKKGFSKRALAEHLALSGIEYRHEIDLGDPKEGRVAARAGDFSRFRAIYGDHLNEKSARESVTLISEVAESQSVCLMCFERDPSQCHRSMVADLLKDLGHSVLDLFADHPGLYVGFASKIARRDTSEGLAAAE
ncbi:MAG: DUF488 domain-containing protein [Siculibacillus sp.]|nr:DUF488 domain-containing protein [Siculibacillus sp.]